ncbi:FAD-dependent pyridine nucleotide-disulphide oxidoreductase [Catenulispora acidiphila DSM 44928]|uniref:FAD-dependent pyridine nucleotide-disulphide oxidoreductase n=1 Tax=Catenulispora acidiphila (strain DSM 44928 / JCM 14897 / NBRC 102108 / NRRL B-24433 / ID139908) TaxID=479433 RepID=C7QJV9_CATAD|nr:FAD-dependent pyridine nucleotide-disulphide oxidoreductase [Catenulispora acidiphila DSM 44928]
MAVIGAGLAAVSLCAALRAGGFTGRLTVVGDEPCHPYDRPPLSKQFLAGERDAAEIALQPPEWYPRERIDLRAGVAVAAFDADTGRVNLADGTTLLADAIVLATGGRARPLTVPGGEAATVLRTRADAEALRDRLAPGVRVLIVGAGLIGAEVAATATHHGCQVTLVDPSPLPMERAIGPHAARALHAQHAAHGVTVVCGGVTAIEAGQAVLTTGQSVPADVVVAGIGIVPNVELAEAAGLDVDNGVLVDAGMQTSVPGVYAIGDIARIGGAVNHGQAVHDGPVHERYRAEHWDNARRTAETAARTILGQPPEAPRAPWFWTDRYGTHLEMTGLYDAAAETVPRGAVEAGDGTVFYLRDGRCVGAVSLNRPLDIRAAQRFIDRDTPVEAAFLADERSDLRRLLMPKVHCPG